MQGGFHSWTAVRWYAAAALCAGAGQTLAKAPVEWDGEAGDLLWFSDDNWNPNGVPGSSDTVTVMSGGPVTAASMGVDVLSMDVFSGLELVSSSLLVASSSMITDIRVGGCCTTTIDAGGGTLTMRGSSVFDKTPAFVGRHRIEGTATFNDQLSVQALSELTIDGDATVLGGRAVLRAGAVGTVTGSLALVNATLSSVPENPDAEWFFDGGDLSYTGSSDAFVNDTVFVTGGSISADTKELEFGDGFVFTDATMHVSNGGRILLNPGGGTGDTQVLEVTSFTGDGRIELDGSAINMNGTVSTSSVTGQGMWIDGLLRIQGELTNTALMQLRGATTSGTGRLVVGSGGTTLVPIGATLGTDIVVRSGGLLDIDAATNLTKEIRIDSGGVLDLANSIRNTTTGPTIDPAVTVFGTLQLPTGIANSGLLDSVKLELRGGGSVQIEDRLLSLAGGGRLEAGVITLIDTANSGHPRLFFSGDSLDRFVLANGVVIQNDGGRADVFFGNGVGSQPQLQIDGQAIVRVTGTQTQVRLRVETLEGSAGAALINEGLLTLQRSTRIEAGIINRGDLRLASNITVATFSPGFVNEANGLVTQTSSFHTDTTSIVRNEGVWNIPNSAQISPANGSDPGAMLFDNRGTLLVDGGFPRIDTAFVNDGDVIVDAAELTLTNTVTVDNQGRRVLSGSWQTLNNGSIVVAQDPPTVLEGEGTEIDGPGDDIDFLDDITVVENGAKIKTTDLQSVDSILFDRGALEVDQGGTVGVAGDIDAVGGSTLTVNQNGSLEATGSIDVGSDDAMLPSVIDDLTGVIELARGTPTPPRVSASQINIHARLTPDGSGVEGMQTEGLLTIHPTGTLHINALANGLSSSISHTGTLDVLGSVRINTIEGYEPSLGDSFAVATVIGAIGTLPTGALGDAGPGLGYAISRSGQEVVVTVVVDCRADLNMDGSLNFFDITEYLGAFNAMDPSADLNMDGLFNFFDLADYLALFNAGCP